MPPKKMANESAAPDVAPELSAMAHEVAALDGDVFDPGPVPDGAGPVAAPDPASEMRDIIALAVGLLAPALPYLPTIYTDEKITALAGAYVPVAEKYGWDVGGALSNWGAEIALAAVAVPLGVQTANAHRAWAEERKLVAMRRQADAEQHFRITRGLDDPAGSSDESAGPGDGTLQAGAPGGMRGD